MDHENKNTAAVSLPLRFSVCRAIRARAKAL
jgi:hypothetical protein